MAGKEFPLNVVIKAVDKLTAPMRGITSKILRLDTLIKSTGRGVSERLGFPVIGAAAGRLGGALGQLGKKLAWIAGGFGTIATAAAVGAYSMINSFAAAGGELHDMSNALGINVEKLQEWQFAARQNGIENEAFVQSLGVLQRNLGKAAMKQGPAVKLLKAWKVDMRDAAGETRRMEELLPIFADKLKAMRSPSLRAAAAAALFGRSGIALLPMLMDGSVGMQKLADRARELGLVMSESSVKDTDNFGDAIDQLKDSLLGVRNTIGFALMPQINQLVKQLTDFVIKNRPQLQAFFSQFAAELPGRIKEAVKFLGDLRRAFQPILDVLIVLSDRFGGANVALGALAAVLAVTLIPSLYATATALYAVGVAILATPVGWIILGIVAIVAAMAYLYDKFAAARMIINAISDATIWFFKNMTPIGILISKWDEMTAAIKTVWEFLTDLWKGFEIGVGMAIDMIVNLARAMIDMIPDWVKNLFSGDTKTININASGPNAMGNNVSAASVSRGLAPPKQEVAVTVDMNNLPAGTRVSTQTRGAPDFELNQGYATGMGRRG